LVSLAKLFMQRKNLGNDQLGFIIVNQKVGSLHFLFLRPLPAYYVTHILLGSMPVAVQYPLNAQRLRGSHYNHSVNGLAGASLVHQSSFADYIGGMLLTGCPPLIIFGHPWMNQSIQRFQSLGAAENFGREIGSIQGTLRTKRQVSEFFFDLLD
jgi:hypothetical protein